MFQNRFLFLLSFILVLFWGESSSAQKKTLAEKEIISLINDASAELNNNQYEKSLLKSRIALEKAITVKNHDLIANSYLIIAANFDELTEPTKALFYYNLGLSYAKRTNNNILKNQFYNNLGNIYCFDKKVYNKGIYYYKKSLSISQKIHDTEQTLLTNLNIAWAHFDINKYDEGFPYLKHVNKYQSIHGDESTIVAVNMLNGMYYNNKDENKKAEKHFTLAIQQGNLGNEKSDLSYSYLEYSKFLNKIGNYKKAYENLRLYNKITDEQQLENKLKKANVIGANLEIDQYKREIDKIETKYKIKQNKLLEEQSRNKKIVIIVFLLFISAIVFFYYFIQNLRLKEKNKLNDLQSKIQENIINASIDGQELERKKIASFLHDNISSLLSSAGIHLKVFTSQNFLQTEEIVKTKTILEEAHNQIRNLSHELMPSLLVRFGLLYGLDDLCEKNSNSNIRIEFNSLVPIKKRYNEEFEMKLYFIVTELLNNIIKHSEASNAKIALEEIDNNLLIVVTDNGNGFIDNEFELKEGFGINQIRARMNNMKGEFIINSILNTGTTIILKTPILNK
ncbi:ATP-binding protein [Flavobacterium laiguense]|uniref:histidine kinase n=1 Tax=Flavobacterium laiguense TaxID=2169409 RepID=A0A2U1JX41_9FLAO|nr:tetratricopeptide repeat-containing sensor histidine kinase [Flavobacterium laiguense]PWA09393.1 two-component sensor histidine kinase [Flavobacterium laiguense]